MLRILANAAVLLALVALGAAAGDFASHPNVLGAVGLVVIVLVFGLAFGRLYGPHGVARWWGPEPVPPESREEPRRPAARKPAAGDPEGPWLGW